MNADDNLMDPHEVAALRDLIERIGWIAFFKRLHEIAQTHIDLMPPDVNLDHPLYDVRNIVYRGVVDLHKAMDMTNNKWTRNLVPRGLEDRNARDFK